MSQVLVKEHPTPQPYSDHGSSPVAENSLEVLHSLVLLLHGKRCVGAQHPGQECTHHLLPLGLLQKQSHIGLICPAVLLLHGHSERSPYRRPSWTFVPAPNCSGGLVGDDDWHIPLLLLLAPAPPFLPRKTLCRLLSPLDLSACSHGSTPTEDLVGWVPAMGLVHLSLAGSFGSC